MKNHPYRSDAFDAIHSSADALLRIRAIDEAGKADLLPIPTPGDILLEEFLKPSGQSQNALARAIGVSPPPYK